MRRNSERRREASSPRGRHISSSPVSDSRPSPLRSRSSRHPPSTATLDDTTFATEDLITELHDLQLSPRKYYSADPNNPRSFPYSVKQQCWEKAEKVKGRDPDRWRRDPLGNLVFRKLVGCPGCLCHDYDHIIPYSKGGKSTLENCQVLQEYCMIFVDLNFHEVCISHGKATVNRSKGNKTDISRADLIQKSSYCRVSGRDMDLIELSAFGNVRRAQDGGCSIQ